MSAELMEQIREIQHELGPIPITPPHLSLLGFVYSGGNYYKSCGSVKVWVLKLKGDRFRVTIENSPWNRVIDYIHELQNIWYNLFQDELFRPAPSPVVQMPIHEHNEPLYAQWQKELQRIKDEERKLNGNRSKYQWQRLPSPTFREFKEKYLNSSKK
ncbi:hypothetical protein M4J38_11015 [Parasegetibacter sp. NRK P23]|nr:hypothetical protein [Parasegetibacter sp. NRK P23]